MHCPYCRHWNAEDEHRCRRCGRRLDSVRPAPEPVAAAALTAAAPVLARQAAQLSTWLLISGDSGLLTSSSSQADSVAGDGQADRGRWLMPGPQPDRPTEGPSPRPGVMPATEQPRDT